MTIVANKGQAKSPQTRNQPTPTGRDGLGDVSGGGRGARRLGCRYQRPRQRRTRAYADWKTITGDAINARVWVGVHFRASDLTGVDQGLRVARWEVQPAR